MTERSPAQDVDNAKMQLDALKVELLAQFTREHPTTMRVLQAVPQSESGFRPHPRSASVLELLATLVREQAGIVAVLDGTWSMPPSFPPAPTTLDEGIAAVGTRGADVIAALKRAPASRLRDSVPFFAGPGLVVPTPIRDLLWFWLLDMIHHRGQLSVYVRMAGGRVPAIYGPSADEPWT